MRDATADPTDRLPQRLDYATTDPDEAHAFLQAAYTENTMVVRGSTNGFALTHGYQSTPAFSLASLEHSMAVEHRAQPLQQLLFCRVVSGHMERDSVGGHERYGPGDVFVVAQSDQPYVVSWDAVHMQLLEVDSGVLRDTAALPGGAEPSFLIDSPASHAELVHAGRVFDVVDEGLLFPDSFGTPLVLDQAARMLAATLLSLFGRSDGDEETVTSAALPRAVTRAVDYIGEHLDQEIGIAEIALAAGVTPRAVQYAFRRHLDTTPEAYLRRARLERAHRELLAGDRDAHLTVADVASRWGFFNPGRFAASYRATYGESPRETLRR